jgi:hypothetical protein
MVWAFPDWVALPHFMCFRGSEQASNTRAAVRMSPGSTQTAGEPLNRGRLTEVACGAGLFSPVDSSNL